RRRHVLVEGRLVALRQAAHVDAEGDQPFEGAAAREILALDAVDIGEVERLVARHLIDVAGGVAGTQHRFAMRTQLRPGGRRVRGLWDQVWTVVMPALASSTSPSVTLL